jgi:hypothetical protein
METVQVVKWIRNGRGGGEAIEMVNLIRHDSIDMAY